VLGSAPSFSKWNSIPSSLRQSLGKVIVEAFRRRVGFRGRHAERVPAQSGFDFAREVAQRAGELRHTEPRPGAGEIGDEIDVERLAHVSHRRE
jgi:hypothetical protein